MIRLAAMVLTRDVKLTSETAGSVHVLTTYVNASVDIKNMETDNACVVRESINHIIPHLGLIL